MTMEAEKTSQSDPVQIDSISAVRIEILDWIE